MAARCYRLNLNLNDGSSSQADFMLKEGIIQICLR